MRMRSMACLNSLFFEFDLRSHGHPHLSDGNYRLVIPEFDGRWHGLVPRLSNLLSFIFIIRRGPLIAYKYCFPCQSRFFQKAAKFCLSESPPFFFSF